MTAIKVAVVGHTNTGKTSLLRTLTRDVAFGEVSDRPAVTRHVEGTALIAAGREVLELYDTPGLEDSIGLLEHLDELGAAAGRDERADRVDVIRAFLDSPEARQRFAQEAKALKQVLASDLALYVIDARDRVLGKHRDELEILARCARPVVPVLNFTADESARTAEWRDHLARVGLHAVAEFDTVVLDEHGERRLLEKMQSMLDRHRGVFEVLIEDRRHERERLIRAAARLLAETMIDVAAYVETVPAGNETSKAPMDAMRGRIRECEQRCVRRLLELFAFRPGDGRLADLPLTGGRWGLDLFSPEAMKRFGVRAGSAAAAGAMAGLAIDAMVGGVTLGAATATGAAIGALLETGRSYGRRFLDRARGRRELRCDDATLGLLLTRQTALIRALLRRGHAAMDPITVGQAQAGATGSTTGSTTGTADDGLARAFALLPDELLKARANPRWSSLPATVTPGPAHTGTASAAGHAPQGNGARDAAVQSLARRIERAIERGESRGGSRPR